jgi:response regulator RpfG family c-di-GMP phosphodiesterase
MRVHKILIVDDDKAVRDLLASLFVPSLQGYRHGRPGTSSGAGSGEQAGCDPFGSNDAQVLRIRTLPKLSLTELHLRDSDHCHTGESDAKYKDHCANLGAVAYFEKPLKFDELKRRLTMELQSKRSEQRAHVRVRMRLSLKLRGAEASGRALEEITSTENVSANGFMRNCMSSLVKDAIVEVILSSGGEHYVGRARVVRKESSGTPWRRYGFQFLEKTDAWPLQDS